MSCPICEHDHRAEIENSPSGNCDLVASKYSLDPEEVKEHLMFHESADSKDSYVRRLKLEEVDMLAEISKEYFNTLQGLSSQLQTLTDSDDPVLVGKALSKPLVDLYLGLGAEVRSSVKTLAELDRLLNGPQDNGTSGLAALAAVLKVSSE